MQYTDIFNKLDSEYKQFKTNLKGCIGETAAALSLKYGTAEKLNFVRNVYVPLSNGKTAEIDLVIIHSTGIYSIECKNYSGWIFGSVDNQYWTQSFSNGKKYSFYNPVRQNNYHIASLSKYLSVPESYFKSYIVFGENCELKKVPSNTEAMTIIKSNELSSVINTDILHRDHLFADTVVDMFSEKIKSLNDNSGQIKTEHINRIKAAHPKQETTSHPNSTSSFVSSFFKF